MITVPAHIATRFMQCLFSFFVHWYFDVARVFWARALRVFHIVSDQFVPAYWGDGTINFALAALRAIFYGLMCLVTAVALSLLYLGWAFFPVYVLYKLLDGLSL